MSKAKAFQAPGLAGRTVYLRLISLLAGAYLLYYLGWRVTSTLNPAAPFFSWMLVLAEAFGVLSYLLFAWMTRNVSPTRAFRPAPAGLEVDILVPTYDESLEILEATLIGCIEVAYPHRTYVLDDGRRDSVRELAHQLGCDYLTRGSNEHAKAGNLNAALQRTSGEFIVVLDADMVPQRDFLEKTLGYFEDPRLAFIQMPQEFYNHDSIQHDRTGPVWHEQALFFRIIQPGKNHSNSAFWCGSPSIIRRAALEDVGGVATSTITEDIHTSVRLHSRGWASYYLDEPLAFGIAPQTIRAFLVQRLRWASGTMQLYGSRESPLLISGLTVGQRISYFASFLAYIESFQKLALLLTPILIILLDVFPMRVNMISFAVRWVPYFLISLFASVAGGRGHFKYFQTEKYSILKMVVFIQSTATFFTRRPLKFSVTPKTVNRSVYAGEARALRLYFVIYGALTGAVLFGFLKVFAWRSTTIGVEALLITLAWAVYNTFVILGGVSDVLGRRHERTQYRFPVGIGATLWPSQQPSLAAEVSLRDLSVSGVGFRAEPVFAYSDAPLALTFRSMRGNRISLDLKLTNCGPLAPDGKSSMGASITNMDPSDRRHLIEFLFVDTPEQWRHLHAQAGMPARSIARIERPAAEPAFAIIPVSKPKSSPAESVPLN